MTGAERPDRRPRPLAHVAAVYATAAVVLATDQVTKHLVVGTLAGRPPVHVLGDLVQLRYTTNTGGAFSLLAGFPLFFGVVAAAVIVAIMVGARRVQAAPAGIALGLILGGAVGNFSDRLLRGPGLLRGEVVDFVDIGRFPVFNVADSCIVTGGVLLALLAGRADSRKGADSPARPNPPPP